MLVPETPFLSNYVGHFLERTLHYRSLSLSFAHKIQLFLSVRTALARQSSRQVYSNSVRYWVARKFSLL